MAGLDPAIYVFRTASKKNVDARVKPGHDEVYGGRRSLYRHCERSEAIQLPLFAAIAMAFDGADACRVRRMAKRSVPTFTSTIVKVGMAQVRLLTTLRSALSRCCFLRHHPQPAM